MRYFSVNCWKIKIWYAFCCFTLFSSLLNARDYRVAILDGPESLNCWAYVSFCMISFHFFIKILKSWCYILWERFNATYRRCYNKTKTNWIFVHFQIQYVTAQSCILLDKQILCLEMYNWCFLIIWSLVLLSIHLGVIIRLIW